MLWSGWSPLSLLFRSLQVSLSIFCAPIKIGITNNFIFNCFFLVSQARSRYLSFFLQSFNFTLWSDWKAKSRMLKVLFLLISWSVCLTKSHWSLCVSFSRTGYGLYIYHLFVWLHLNFLRNSQSITVLTQLFLVLNSFGLICCIRSYD